MADMAEIDSKMAKLMNLKQEWIDNSFPGNIADIMRKELHAIPAGLSDVHKQFFEEIEKELDRGVKIRKAGLGKARLVTIPAQYISKTEEIEYDAELLKSFPSEFLHFFVPALKSPPESAQNVIKQLLRYETGTAGRERQMLPVRNCCNDIPGHIECFKENNGLIHGGIVHTPSYTLVCRAFRFFVWKNLGKFDDLSTDVVAGICEQKDRSGNLINRWSTAERLQEYYSSTSIPLPAFAEQYDMNNLIFRGYYYPQRFIKDVFEQGRQGRRVVESPDDGIPIQGFIYNPPPNFNPAFHQFMRPPTYETAVENALYNQPAYCTDGFPICTPYIKVFSPGPGCQETIVSMIGAYREIRISGRPPQVWYERKAEWYVKTFN